MKRRRAAGGTDQQERALDDQLDRERAAGVSELERPRDDKRLRVRSQLARRARRAVLGMLEMAQKIVVLE